jgi:hypothetical protein
MLNFFVVELSLSISKTGKTVACASFLPNLNRTTRSVGLGNPSESQKSSRSGVASGRHGMGRSKLISVGEKEVGDVRAAEGLANNGRVSATNSITAVNVHPAGCF